MIAGSSAFSRFAFSILTDKFGGRACLTFAIFGQSTSILILLIATEAWHFYATGTYTAAIIVTAAIGYVGVPLSLWLPRHDRGGRTQAKAVAPA